MPPLATLARVADALLDIRRDISRLDDVSLCASLDLTLLLLGRRLAVQLMPGASVEGSAPAAAAPHEAASRRPGRGGAARRLRR